VFVPGKPFQPGLVFAGEARNLNGGTLRYTRLVRLTRDEHSSLLRTFVNYDRKKFKAVFSGFFETKIS
jgi:hypothetical protein